MNSNYSVNFTLTSGKNKQISFDIPSINILLLDKTSLNNKWSGFIGFNKNVDIQYFPFSNLQDIKTFNFTKKQRKNNNLLYNILNNPNIVWKYFIDDDKETFKYNIEKSICCKEKIKRIDTDISDHNNLCYISNKVDSIYFNKYDNKETPNMNIQLQPVYDENIHISDEYLYSEFCFVSYSSNAADMKNISFSTNTQTSSLTNSSPPKNVIESKNMVKTLCKNINNFFTSKPKIEV